jgi:hypothetical protein
MDKIFIEEMNNFIRDNANKPDELLRTMQGIKFAMIDNVSYVSIPIPNMEPIYIKWEKGLLSGLRWTALMGTIYNYAILYVARQYLSKVLGVQPVIRKIVAQGDDDDIEVSGCKIAVGLIKAYEQMSVPINTKKFFVDTRRHEYLRKIGVVDELGARVTGYPARAVNSLLWRNPVNSEPPKGKKRIEEQVKQWMVMSSRGCVYARVRRHMLHDVSRANNISKRNISELLNTPRYRGGFGLEGQSGRLGMEPEVYTVNFRRMLPYGNVVPGLRSSLDFWGKHNVAFTDKHIDDYMGSRLKTNLRTERLRAFKLVKSTDDVKMDARKMRINGSFPLVAPVNPELYLTLRDVVLRMKIRDRRWEWIHDVYVAPEWRSLSRRIEKRGSRKFWLSWILGEFDFSPPVHHLFSSEAVAHIHRQNVNGRWAKVLCQRRFNTLSVKRAIASAEHDTFVELKTRRPIIGE